MEVHDNPERLSLFEGLSEADIGRMTRDQVARMLGILEAQKKREGQRLFWRYFPDKDTSYPGGVMFHAREKYAKHLEFFRVGATFRERCFMAANRCITPWTWLQTPAGEALSAEVWTSEDATVLAWDGEAERTAQAQHGILKCIEPAFRLVMGSGRFFDCTRKHRVLSNEGWLSLDQIVSRASGLRLWHRREDYQANCVAGGYLGGQPLRSLGGIDLASLRPQGDAQGRAPLIFALPDEAEQTLRHIRACQGRDRLSSQDDLYRFAALFAMFAGASSAQSCLSLSECTRDVLRFVQASVAQLRQDGERYRDQSDAYDRLASALKGCLGGSCTRTGTDAIRRSGALCHDVQDLGGSVQEWFDGEGRIAIFYPYGHVPLVGGEHIAAIVPLGLQPIIDATVPEHQNYKAAGVYHHNTGKTVAGAYETSCHLTGLYPDWWEGRRFDRPIRAWAAGKTNETTRDIVQGSLMGEVQPGVARKGFTGTGLVPGALIKQDSVAWKQGVADLCDTVKVKHASGGWSQLGFKSYQQGRGSFEGTAQHVIWLDEEPPLDVYGECLIRTATTKGIILLTFTPLEGMSETVMQFMPQEHKTDA